MDSIERTSDALLPLEGFSQDASQEACASLEDGISTMGPPRADNAVGEAPSMETAVVPLLSAR